MLAPAVARAVIFDATGDVTFNTTAPTGALAGSGWQYQINYGLYLATAVGPNHIMTAAHQGAIVGNTFTYNGVNYQTVAFSPTEGVKDFGDLRLLRVDKPIYSYAPLYDGATDGSETGKTAVIFGRGKNRGAEFFHNGTARGWEWGEHDFVRRWGTNVVTTTTTPLGTSVMKLDFDKPGTGVNEAALAANDSGGAGFIEVNGQWKLAGINYFTSAYSTTSNGPVFQAALYNTSGLWERTFGGVPTAASGPSSAYLSRVSASLGGMNGIRSYLNLPPTWKLNAAGTLNWNTASNWSTAAVPNAVGAIADLRTAITAPRTIAYGTSTVGTINIDSAHGYTVQPSPTSGSNTLNLNVAGGSAAVNVASGSHTILGLTLHDPTTFNVIRGDSKLTVSMNAAGQPVTKDGDGTLEARRVRAAQLNVNQGKVAITPDGGTAGVSKVSSLNLAPGTTLDLANNHLVVANTPVGPNAGASYTGLAGAIAAGRGEDGAWAGASGITSSAAAADASGLTGLAVASAADAIGLQGSETTLWAGQTIGASDALIAYTYTGDANLDGFVDGGDYAWIDAYVGSVGADVSYLHGDFNYDGFIDGGDYAYIDVNVGLSGLIPPSPAAASSALSVAAVPEPAGLSLAAIASAFALGRRRPAPRRVASRPTAACCCV